MPVTEKKIQIGYTDSGSAPQSFEIALPVFPYTTKIFLPFEVVRLGKGHAVYDNGNTYDVRQCECTFLLTATEMGYLRDAFGTDSKARGRACTFTMLAASGFFPFGHDKGDVGAFTGTLEITKDYGAQESPYLYHKCDCVLTNTGEWPAYSMPDDPTDATEGLSIGEIANIRFPQSFFNPSAIYGAHIGLTQGGAAKFTNRGVSGDRYETDFELWMSAAKAARVIDQLVRVIRNNAFNLVTQTNYQPFGLDKGSGTFSCKLLNELLEINHEKYNSVYLPLKLGYVSGP